MQRKASVAIGILALLALPALAQSRKGCVDAKDHYQAIKACSEIIRANPKDAIAYHMRGVAMAKNGDLGQAIADYVKSIQLNPAYAPAYDSRAAVLVSRGDFAGAVADVTKAGELGAQRERQVKVKAPVRAKPKMSSWASAKGKDRKGETTFNPFADGASPQ